MKKSELKSKIREQILTNLSEKKKKDKEEEPTLERPDMGDETETPPTDSTPNDFGVDPKIQTLQNALKAAYDAAKDMGDDKLETQIGNTITYFTRAHVVKKDDGVSETLRETLKKLIKQKLKK